MESIRFFSHLSKADVHLAGGKGASLGEMTQAGIPVPPGYVVLTDAFEQFLTEAELHEEIQAQLDSVNHHEMETVERASETIRAIIMNAKMPEDIAATLHTSFDKLGAEYVAVRSSATAEDGANASWAGELDSFLNTRKDKLTEKVQACWASLFTPRAIFYRFEKGFHTSKVSVAVVVQKMVNSDVSGIAFSVHPVTEDHNQLIIEAGWGLGEAIVSGSITPDNFVVDKRDWSLVDSYIASQEKKMVKVAGGGSEWAEVPASKQEVAKISPEKVTELAKLVVHIEKHYGFPCDIEWAMEDDTLYVVQSRPITTLSS
jgi:pyruvate,water dikinase